MELEEFVTRLGKRLRKIRHEREYSQLDLSVRSGVPKETISKIENGHRPATLETLLKLAGALEIGVKDLMDFEVEK